MPYGGRVTLAFHRMPQDGRAQAREAREPCAAGPAESLARSAREE